MSARAQTVRLTPPQQRALVAFAKQRGLSEYAMLARVVDAGLASLIPGTLVLWLLGAFAFHVGSGLFISCSCQQSLHLCINW